MSRPTESRDGDDRALSQALREQAGQESTPDVSEALQQRLRRETRDSAVGYVAVQVLLLVALLVAGAWYFWR